MVETLVNATTADFQGYPVVATGADDGSFVVTWESAGQDGSGSGIFGQRYAADGTPIGGEFRINATTAGGQLSPAAAMAADGSFVVTWMSDGQDGSGSGVYGQRFGADGMPAGDEFQINTTAASDQQDPSVAMAADGSFVVTWMSGGQDGSGWGIYGRRYAADGTALGDEFLVNTATGGNQLGPSVAMADDGSFAVTWQSDGGADSGDIYGQRYGAGGAALGEIQINTTLTTGTQTNPSIAMAADGRYVVVWASDGIDGAGPGIYGQRYGAGGTAIGEFHISTSGSSWDEPSVAMADDGRFVVTWLSDGDIYAQRYDAAGTALGGEFRINTVTTDDQGGASIAMAADGSFTVTWHSGSGSSYDVHMQRFDAAGLPLPDPDLNGAAAGSDYDPGTITFAFAPVPVTAADATLTGDPDQTVTGLAAQLGGQRDAGDKLSLTAAARDAADLAGLQVGPDGSTLTITGDAVLSVYEAILRGVVYINGDALSESRTVTITVSGVGGAGSSAVSTLDIDGNPRGMADSYSVTEDMSLTVTASGVLANDMDFGTLGAVLLGGPSHGTLDLNLDGSFTYTPAANYSGTDSFRYRPEDNGSGFIVPVIVTLNVTAVNDAPTAVGSLILDQAKNEDQAFTFTLPAGAFTDVDAGDSLTYTATLANGDPLPAWLHFDAATRSFAGTAGNADVGDLTIRVTATDSGGSSASDDFTLTIVNTNDAPTVANLISDQTATEGQAFTFALPSDAFADVDAGDSLTYTATLASGSPLPSWLIFDGTTFTGTPRNGDVGAITIRVTATDGDATISSDFILTIGNVNDAPSLANGIADQIAPQDAEFSFIVPADAFADIDAGDSLTYTAALAGGGALPGWLHFDAATGTFSGTPTNDDVGAIAVTVTASDGSASISDDFIITIANANDAPSVANPIADQTVTEDEGFNFTVPADAFVDVDTGDSLTYSAGLAGFDPLPAWLHFDAATRHFTGTPGNDDVGAITIYVYAGDGHGVSTRDSFTLTVANANDAPSLANGIADQTATEDQPFGFAIPAGSFADIDAGDSLTYTAVLAGGGALPGWLHLDSTTGVFTGAPANADVGVIAITVTATDSGGATVSDDFTLTIGNVNDAPVALADAYATTAGAAITIAAAAGLLVNDTDADQDSLILSLAEGPDHGSLTLHADGSFTYTPEDGFAGSDRFTYSVDDGHGGTQAAEVTLTVTPLTTAGPAPTLDILAMPLDLQVSALYVAFFGRGADGDGFDYWQDDIAHYQETTGQPYGSIYTGVADNFARSAEAQGAYAIFGNPDPGIQDIHDFLGAVYDNLFNRAPDAAGLAYWTAEIGQILGRGGFVGEVLVTIIGGAQNSADGQDITTLANKAVVGQAYAEMLQEQGIGWDPDSDMGDATSLVDAVTDDPLSVLQALQQIDRIAQDHHLI